MRDETFQGKAGRERKELAFAVECQALGWLQTESLMCYNEACPDLSSLILSLDLGVTYKEKPKGEQKARHLPSQALVSYSTLCAWGGGKVFCSR